MRSIVSHPKLCAWARRFLFISPTITTAAQSKDTFSILEVEATLTFNREGDKVTGFTLSQGGAKFAFKRVEQK